MTELARTLHEIAWYPDHDPRKASAEYHRTHEHLVVTLDTPCWICGISHSQGGAMETHHAELEWAAEKAFENDRQMLDKLVGDLHEKITAATSEAVREFLDSEGNMLVLCLPGDAPVLRPDGSSTAIATLRPGDEVLCPDGRSRQLTHVIRREYEGDLVRLDGNAVTPNHPVLTPRGWLPAGLIREGDEVGQYLRVLGHEMLDVRAVEPEVLRAIVASDVVDMMNPFRAVQGAPEFLLHDPPVLEDRAFSPVLPYVPADIALGCEPTAEEHAVGGGTLTRDLLECGHPTLVAAEPGSTVARREAASTLAAGPRIEFAVRLSTPRGRTLARAGRVAASDLGRDPEAAAADKTLLQRAPGASGAKAWWRAVRNVERVRFTGHVYDITVTSFPAFVTDGLVVHNCAVHHRGPYTGIHSITYPVWKLQRFQHQGGFEFVRTP